MDNEMKKAINFAIGTLAHRIEFLTSLPMCPRVDGVLDTYAYSVAKEIEQCRESVKALVKLMGSKEPEESLTKEADLPATEKEAGTESIGGKAGLFAYNIQFMTIEQFFGETQFDVCEGFMFQDSLAVAYKRPKPTLFLSASMIKYLKTEIQTDGQIEFLRNIHINIAEEWNPIFKPIIVK